MYIFKFVFSRYMPWGFPGGLEGKAFTCNMGDPGSIRDLGSIPGSGRSPEKEMAPHFSTLA